MFLVGFLGNTSILMLHTDKYAADRSCSMKHSFRLLHIQFIHLSAYVKSETESHVVQGTRSSSAFRTSLRVPQFAYILFSLWLWLWPLLVDPLDATYASTVSSFQSARATQTTVPRSVSLPLCLSLCVCPSHQVFDALERAFVVTFIYLYLIFKQL